MKILITGGAGFIGSNVIRNILATTNDQVVNLDKLTYAGNLCSLDKISASKRYSFERVDICDRSEVERVFRAHEPDSVIHLAAESHVDRSIEFAAVFIKTNIVGTHTLLEVAHKYWSGLDAKHSAAFRFLHVSTDEVYGDLGYSNEQFSESSSYAPSSPYSASKAAADHLVRAWFRTYGLPTLVSNCSNNYGPYQFPEKLIPLMIRNALDGKLMPVYGQGRQVRDWLYVNDHAIALYEVLTKGRVGETYNIGGQSEMKNIEVVEILCELLEALAPRKPAGVANYRDLVTFVKDRPGHDIRYAIDSTKIQSELNWTPNETFETGLRTTVNWYLHNLSWVSNVASGAYRDRVSDSNGEQK